MKPSGLAIAPRGPHASFVHRGRGWPASRWCRPRRSAGQSAPPKTSGAPGSMAPGTPLSLDEALRAAAKASELIEVARDDVERSRTFVTTARAGYLPIVNGTAAYQRTLKIEFDDISFGRRADDDDRRSSSRSVAQQLARGVDRRPAAVRRLPHSLAMGRPGGRALTQLGVTRRDRVVLQARSHITTRCRGSSVGRSAGHTPAGEADARRDQHQFTQGTAPSSCLRGGHARQLEQHLVDLPSSAMSRMCSCDGLLGVPVDKPITLTTKLEDEDVDAGVATGSVGGGVPPAQTRVAIAQAADRCRARRRRRARESPVVPDDLGGHRPRVRDYRTIRSRRTGRRTGPSVSTSRFRSSTGSAAKRSSWLARPSSSPRARSSRPPPRPASRDRAGGPRTSRRASKTLETTPAPSVRRSARIRLPTCGFSKARRRTSSWSMLVSSSNRRSSTRRAQHTLRIARIRQELLPGLRLGAVLAVPSRALCRMLEASKAVPELYVRFVGRVRFCSEVACGVQEAVTRPTETSRGPRSSRPRTSSRSSAASSRRARASPARSRRATRSVVRAETSGTVLQIGPELGQTVKKGDLLARVEAKALGDMSSSAQGIVASAQAQLDLAKREVERTEALVKGGALAQRELDRAQSQVTAAQAQVTQAKAQLASSKSQLGDATVRVAVRRRRRAALGRPVTSCRRVRELYEVIDPSRRCGSMRRSRPMTCRRSSRARPSTSRCAVIPPAVCGNDRARRAGGRSGDAPDPGPRRYSRTRAASSIAGLYAEGRVAVERREALSRRSRRSIRPATSRPCCA